MHYYGMLWQRLVNTGRLVINIVLAFVFMILSFSIKNPVLPKTVAYGFVREAAKKNLELQTRDWLQIQGHHFTVKYTHKDEEVAQMVLNTAEEAYSSVNNMLEYNHQEPIPVVIYPNRRSLGKSFGWDADESAMGVYWAGVIRVLSPNEWIYGKEGYEMTRYFRQNGPMTHEYAHLVVDYKTRGNYPRWFTEGVAQLVEKQITGFQFAPVSSTEDWYSIKEMDRGFDELSDQSLAYGQSLAMIEFLVEEYGHEKLQGIMDRLGEGKTISGAFIHEIGINLEQFEKSFKEWMLVREE
ncbi:MAG: hypothetical protein JG764_1416 [Clostridiales bacterium]|jgi:hypothetical protein|nr:hypothetical protein [Clostridiales bacterium]